MAHENIKKNVFRAQNILKSVAHSHNMSSKRQQIPLKISNWIEQDTKVRKFTPNIGSMSKDARQNVMLSRKFFSNMFNLSSERFRKISQYDFHKKKFINDQHMKAEKFMPGLLPYIEPYMENINNNTQSSSCSSKKNESFHSSSFQSFATRSNTKAEFSALTRESTMYKNKISSVTPPKYYNRPEKSFERKTCISKNQFPDPYAKRHVRPHYHEELTVEDLFGDLDDNSSYRSSSSNDKPKSAPRDRRFRQLIHLFSEVHEGDPSNTKTIKNIIESNSSLKNKEKSWEKMNIDNSNTVYFEDPQQLPADELYIKTDVYLIDSAA